MRKAAFVTNINQIKDDKTCFLFFPSVYDDERVVAIALWGCVSCLPPGLYWLMLPTIIMVCFLEF